MRAEIVGIGTEILLGQIANSNAQWISSRLADIGIDVLHHQAVGDNDDRIAGALRLALSRAEVVICTGGLGPTQDDITRAALAEVTGAPLVRDEEVATRIRELFARRGRTMPESNLRQADVPAGATVITPDTDVAVREEGQKLMVVPQGASLGEVVQALNAIMARHGSGYVAQQLHAGDVAFRCQQGQMPMVVRRILPPGRRTRRNSERAALKSARR